MKRLPSGLLRSFAVVVCAGAILVSAANARAEQSWTSKSLTHDRRSVCISHGALNIISVKVTGAFVGTLGFEATGDGGEVSPLMGYGYNSINGTQRVSRDFSGYVQPRSSGQLCLRWISYTSGYAFVRLIARKAAASVTQGPGKSAPGPIGDERGTSAPASGQAALVTAVAENGAPQLTGLTITNSKTTTTLDIASQKGNDAILDITSAKNPAYIYLRNDATSPSPLTQVANIIAYAKYPHPRMGSIEFGSAGSTPGDYGGFIAFHVKADDGTDSMPEGLVIDAQAHVYMPNNEYLARFKTPAHCNALIVCGTRTFTFTTPYETTTGGAATPECSAPGIKDDSSSDTIWIGSIRRVSSGSVTYNFASSTALTSPHTIYMYIVCWTQSY